MLDRSAKQFFAVSLLMVGLLLVVNLSVSREAMTDWSWVLALAALLGAGIFVILLWQETRPKSEVRSIRVEDRTGSLHLPQSHVRVFEVNSALTPGTAVTIAQGGDDPIPFDLLGDELAAGSPTATVELAATAPEVYAPSSEVVSEVQPEAVEQYALSSESVSEAQAEAAESEVDDLQMIEGIGPKYEEALVQAGVKKWAQLAQTTTEQLAEALQKAGYSRIPASIVTWAEQAGYLVRGDHDGLKALQDQLIGGRRADGGDD
jgi:predicted flap endonuclease-1-like 5' DNA nuclease